MVYFSPDNFIELIDCVMVFHFREEVLSVPSGVSSGWQTALALRTGSPRSM